MALQGMHNLDLQALKCLAHWDDKPIDLSSCNNPRLWDRILH